MRSAFLTILAVLVLSTAPGCTAGMTAGPSVAFEDCYNRPPLYCSANGCEEGGGR